MNVYEINDKEKYGFSCIYLWTNLINGKVYVGQTQNFYNRMIRYKNGGEQHRIIGQALNKYGFDNFDISILEQDVPLDNLDTREQYWMDYYNSYDLSIGYNLCKEAGTTRGYQHTQEDKEKMSALRQQWWKEHPDIKGENHPSYGKHPSEETRQKMSQSRIGNQNAKGKTWKLSEEFVENCRQRALGNKYCLGRKISEYHRQRIIEFNKGRICSEETKRKISEANSSENNKMSKKVRCVETGEIFPSASEASRSLGKDISGVARCCRGKQKTCGKLHWEYVDEKQSV